jgi:hypothetical protein
MALYIAYKETNFPIVPLKGSLNSEKTENERMGKIGTTFKWAFK